jgi:hypothetical protein
MPSIEIFASDFGKKTPKGDGCPVSGLCFGWSFAISIIGIASHWAF